MNPPNKILVIGGVAGGASAAARARRLCERCEIILFDKGPFVSFANCGLPYFVGNVIKEEKKLIVASPELFKERFNIEARTENEVLSIDRDKKEVLVVALRKNKTYVESYTHLVLSPGAKPLRPPIPGIDLPGIFALRTIPDSRKILSWLHDHKTEKAAIVGGGFIGLEMAENLAGHGLKVTIIDLANQIMPPLDSEMAVPVEEKLKSKGVELVLGDSVEAFTQDENQGLRLKTKSGKEISADMAILAIGIRPETELAEKAGLKIGGRGGITVNEEMQTSDPSIWAVGDVVESVDFVTGQDVLVPLAGPANRQGRIAADNIFNRGSKFRGVQGTAVCEVFGLTIAMTGASERALVRAGHKKFEKIYLHPGNHVGYFPGAKPIHMKILFNPENGLILGAQAIGEAGVARRIDVIAMAIQKGGTVFDLEEAELCYAPQFGAAKDPVNFAGMIASNSIRGDLPLARWDELTPDSVVVDVRDPYEFEAGAIPGAINIPLTEMRDRVDELKNKDCVYVYCQVGQRAYYAVRLLRQNGITVRNLPGGITTWRMVQGVSH